MKKIFVLIIAALLFPSCEEEKAKEKVSGKLFIIGGGARSDQMLNEIIDLAGVRSDGYMYVLPMASSVPDSSILWAKEDFSVTRVNKITGFMVCKRKSPVLPHTKPESGLKNLQSTRASARPLTFRDIQFIPLFVVFRITEGLA